MEPTLPKNSPDPRVRQAELAVMREKYKWDHDYLPKVALLKEPGTEKPSNLQSSIGWLWQLPRGEWPTIRYLYNRVKIQSTWSYYMKTTGSDWKGNFLTHIQYDRIFNRRITDPWCINNWKRDSVFAYQRLSGPNPMVIRRVTKGSLPERLCVKGTSMEAGLPDGTSLDAAIEAGRLFVQDYAVLTGLPLNEGRFLPAPIGVFYLDRNRQLQPLAIQLSQDPKPEMVYGIDDGNAWWMAKIQYQAADLNHHEMVNHLGKTHFVLEGVTVALNRTLAKNHPMSILMKPHLRFLVWNNFQGRQKLISEVGFASAIMSIGSAGCCELVRRSIAGHPETNSPAFNVEMWDLPKELESRGMYERVDYSATRWKRVGEIADYHYRDDGLLIWDALKEYVTNYVGIYYPRDQDVVDDVELQAFVTELVQEAKLGGQKPKLETIDDVTTLFTRIIWAAGPLHAAVNFPQYGFMAYVPNMPAAIYKMPPESLDWRGGSPEKQWAQYVLIGQMLPPPTKIQLQLYTMMLLVSYRYDKLGHYGRGDFKDPEALKVIAAFQKKLADVELLIEEAQAVRRGYNLSYPWLLPSMVTNSTSI